MRKFSIMVWAGIFALLTLAAYNQASSQDIPVEGGDGHGQSFCNEPEYLFEIFTAEDPRDLVEEYLSTGLCVHLPMPINFIFEEKVIEGYMSARGIKSDIWRVRQDFYEPSIQYVATDTPESY